jgi:hypothetical protein
MNWRTISFLLTLLAPCPVLAELMPLLPPAASQLCRQAITAAERAHGIPSHLLAAIARVESGRRDQTSGTFNPWPWTINMDGQGSFYDNKLQAVAAAVSMRPRTTRSIDVGCMQISLIYHPDAFPSMAQAFDPGSNADYGARYLVQLYGKTNSWPKAVELYHSATPEIGQDYGRRVYGALPEEQKLADATQAYPLTNGWASSVNRSLLALPLRSIAPHIIPLAPSLAGGVPPGRSLAYYRLMPVRLAFRGP